MRCLSTATLVAVSTIALTHMAAAADLPRKAPPAPPPPVYSWTGFYVGGNIGGGWGSRDVSYSANDPFSTAMLTDPTSDPGFVPLPASFDTSGLIGGVQVGYNWQLNRNWLVGLETDFDWSGMRGSATTINNLGSGITTNVDEHIRWFGTVRARIGYLPVDSLLVYATGGFAYGRVERTGNYSSNNPGVSLLGFPIGGFAFVCNGGTVCFTGSSSGIDTGWTAGGGLEYAFWQKWTVRAEYLYVSLASRSVTETALNGGGFTPTSFNANFGRTNFNVARAGLSYRF
jgi:outer membrane immunogenic protein